MPCMQIALALSFPNVVLEEGPEHSKMIKITLPKECFGEVLLPESLFSDAVLGAVKTIKKAKSKKS